VQPILSPLLESRPTCQIVTAAAGIHLGLVSLGLPSWQCPLKQATGIPCPGCGLTRALQALALGDWSRAMAIHAFAPVVAVVLCCILVAAFLPDSPRAKLTQPLLQLEQRTGITLIVGGTLVLYWLIRIVFFQQQLYDWVR
jgi:hypothetical protein